MPPADREPPSSAREYYGELEVPLRERVSRAWRSRGPVRFFAGTALVLVRRLIYYDSARVYFMDLRTEWSGGLGRSLDPVDRGTLHYEHPDENALARMEWPEEFEMSDARRRKFLYQRRAGNEVVVQFVDGVPIGYCFLEKGNYRILRRWLFAEDPTMIGFCDAFVVPSQRGRRRYVALLCHCIEWSRANGFVRMMTGMMSWNTASRKGIERVGFRQTGVVHIYWLVGRPREYKDARLRRFEGEELIDAVRLRK